MDVDPWTTTAAVASAPRLAGVDLTGVDVGAAVDVASWLLTEWSGRNEGTSTTTRTYHPAWMPMPNVDVGRFPFGIGCGTRLELGGYVEDVLEVAVDGVPLADTVWSLYRHEAIERTDGLMWSGTVVVSFVSGHPPSAAGQAAAVALAAEIVLDSAGKACRLPANVLTVARQGVTVTTKAKDPAAGRVGITAVDLYLAAINPKARRRRSTVASPDTYRR